MLLTLPGREEAIRNIARAAAEGRFNDKTEPFDPVADPAAVREASERYLREIGTPGFRIRNAMARAIVNYWRLRYSVRTDRIIGEEKLRAVKGSAFLTGNHFNPFDNGVIRTLSRRTGHGRLWAVSQGTNLLMDGINGFVLRNIDVIPLTADPSFMAGPFRRQMNRVLQEGRLVLIYPEQEMWFNYRKPRPGKRGAYLFAARSGVPVVPLFIGMEDLDKESVPGWRDVRLVLHVLDPIYPDPARTDRENSFDMCRRDYEAKVRAYESFYSRKLDYGFVPEDIAGWRPEEG